MVDRRGLKVSWEETQTGALAAAARALKDLGFERRTKRTWDGPLDLGELQVEASVELADWFPDQLPRILVEPEALPQRVPHLERGGKVCIAPGKGLLIAAGRPADVIGEALERAARTIKEGLSGGNEADFIAEFTAYWEPTTRTVFSLCPEPTVAEPLAVRTLRGGKLDDSTLLSDTPERVERWVARLGLGIDDSEEDWFLLPLQEAFKPPAFEEILRARDTGKKLLAAAGEQVAAEYTEWLSRGEARLPLNVLLSLPDPSDPEERFLVGLSFRIPTQNEAPGAAAGFRPGRAPAKLMLGRGPKTKVDQIKVSRLDAEALVSRGGGDPELLNRSVAVVGIGSVGSKVASQLAALGIGELILIDEEELREENVHRHELGMDSVGKPKAAAHAQVLQARYPHLNIRGHQYEVRDLLLEKQPGLVLDADLLVLALGDENLERRLNDLLYVTPRVHTWVEPYGLAVHAALVGFEDQPCFECLYGPIDGYDRVNQGMLAYPGQDVLRTQTGCAGGYMPFSSIDASRAAGETARLVTEALSGGLTESTLITAVGDRRLFLAAGHRLTARAEQLADGMTERISIPVRPECSTCRDHH